MNEKETELKSTEREKLFKKMYGMVPEMSLQSAHFATTENPLLTEYYDEREEDDK